MKSLTFYMVSVRRKRCRINATFCLPFSLWCPFPLSNEIIQMNLLNYSLNYSIGRYVCKFKKKQILNCRKFVTDTQTTKPNTKQIKWILRFHKLIISNEKSTLVICMYSTTHMYKKIETSYHLIKTNGVFDDKYLHYFINDISMKFICNRWMYNIFPFM